MDPKQQQPISEVRPANARVTRPGFPRPHDSHERHVLIGGAARLLRLHAEDRVRIIDPEGLQPALVAVYDSTGNPLDGALRINDSVNGQPALQAWLNSADPRASTFLRQLGPLGIKLDPQATRLTLGADANGRDETNLEAGTECQVLLLALPDPLGVFGHRPTSELCVQVWRRNVPLLPDGIKGHYHLPETLADARLDFQVDRRSARAYEVKAGEFVQIIDPFGRQCSDFIAFPLRALALGDMRFIDSTVSRSLTRTSYPQPGLLDRFYDQDMQPLLRVLQDTCGRHDTFALACTERGYADAGYPGHTNCSDNISMAGAPHGVQARRAWPAINFFFNTAVAAGNRIVSDEGWSRAGDYVLMRAETDLLCISTACPDDTTAINGWNPTDVHVRVYPANNEFKRAVAYRMTANSEPVLTRETGFHKRTSALTRHYRQAREYWVPTQFTNHGAVAEHRACRDAVTVMDMSQLCKFEISGPDAEQLLQRCMTRDMTRMGPGHVLYSLMCYSHGGILDDGTLFRFGPNNFRWVCGNPHSALWLREQASKLELDAFVRTATHELHNIAVQGPRSRELLSTLIWSPATQPQLSELGWFRNLIGRLGDRDGIPLVVSRTGYTGELGYEIFCSPHDAVALWDAVSDAGRHLGLLPMGSDALEILRIEAALAAGGQEFTSETDPIEAGLAFAVPASKTADFHGRAAIEAARMQPRRVLVGLELQGNEVPSHGDGIYLGLARIGNVTSATRSPLLGKTIALARVAAEYAQPGTALEIGQLDGLQKRLLATVHTLPFHDPEKKRVRA